MYKRILSCMLIILMMLLVFGCNKGRKETDEYIKIGCLLSSEDPVSSDMVNCINLAVNDVNDSGGINGKTVKLVIQDSGNTKAKTENACKQLMNSEKVSVIISYMHDDYINSIALCAQQAKTPIIILSSEGKNITSVGDYVFNVYFNKVNQSQACAKFAAEVIHKKKAAVLFNSSDDNLKSPANDFEKEFIANSGSIVYKKAYTSSENDYVGLLAPMKDDKPDVLYIADNSKTVSIIAKQIRALGMTDLTIIGSDQWEGIEKYCGREIVGCYYSGPFTFDSAEQNVVDFLKKYQALYNKIPAANAVLGYDSAMALLDALKATGSLDREKIRDALGSTNGAYLSGNFKLDANRNSMMGTTIYKLEMIDGKVTSKYYTTINP